MDHTKQHDELAQSMTSEKDKEHLEKEKCYWGHFDRKTITVVYLFNATDYEDAVDDVIQQTIDHVNTDKEKVELKKSENDSQKS